MYRKLICLIGLMAVCAWSASALATTLVDDFNSYPNGQVDAVTTTWKGIVGSGGQPTPAAITADSNSAYNKVMRILCNNWGGTYCILSGDTIIANGTTKTLFMRVRTSTTDTDASFGMTSRDVPISNGWADYGPQFRILSGNIQARDGTGWGTTLPVAANTWYYVWVVVNHATPPATLNTFKVYINASGNTATETDRLGATSEYGFRYTPDVNAMDRFVAFTGMNGGGDNTWEIWVDDIYVADGANLTAMWEKWASSPNPADNSTYSGTNATLRWAKGRSVAAHDVYFDTDFADVNSATRTNHLGLLHYSENQEPNNYPITGLIPATTYYWRIDEVNSPPPHYKGKVWNFTTKSLTAYNPIPPNGDILVDPDTNISWSAGMNAVTHDVNFGTGNPPPFIQNQGGTTYNPPGTLLLDTTYYWQITEVNGVNRWTGPVWSFKTWPYTPITTDPTLVGWWKFENSGGGKTRDWSGYNRHGTLYGSPAYATGIFGDAIELDGINDWVSVGSVGISGAAPRTIAGWAKMNTTIGADIQFTNVFGFFAGGNTTVHTCFNIDVTGNQMPGVPNNWYMIHILNWQQYILPPDLDWHHFAATYDGSKVCWYGDGVLINEEVPPAPILNTTDNVQMGKRTTSEDTFQGLIDDVRIYNRALTLGEIKLIMSPPQASLPKPINNDTEVDKNPTLTWKPGCYVAGTNGHELYFSSVFNDVNERKTAAGPHILNNPIYTPTGPLDDPNHVSPKTYYWRVDEVNDHPDSPWEGNVWRFTVPIYKVVDNFEEYTATGTQNLENPTYPLTPTTEGSRLLRRTWIDGLRAMGWSGEPPLPTTTATSGSYVQLNTDPRDGNTPFSNKGNIAQGGIKSMKFYYDNNGTIEWVNDLELPLSYLGESYGSNWNYSTPNYYSEASAAIDDAVRISSDQNSLGMSKDWSGYKLLKISYYGDPNNALTIVPTDKLYVTLTDRSASGHIATVTNPDQTYIKRSGWHNWYIPLSIGSGSFKAQNGALNLEDVNRIYIGIGNRASPVSGGKGAIFFDDIQLYPVSVCNSIPGALAGDFSGNCKVDANDLQKMTQVWLGKMPTPPTPVISLDASDLTLGTLSQWDNDGSAGGSFVDFNMPKQPGYRPRVQMVEGVRAVVFDNNDIMKANIDAPASITGSHAYTVIYKVWNLEIGANERVFSWSTRGGTIEGKYAGVGYGSNVAYGAVGHGIAGPNDPNFDMGFNGVPAAHTWHTIAVTYTGGTNGTETLMVDGVVKAIEVKTLNIWQGCDMTIGDAYDGNSIAVPPLSQVIVPAATLFFSGALANLKVYDVAIPPGDLAILMGTTGWMGTSVGTPDINNDSVINFKDLALLANKWMQTVLFP